MKQSNARWYRERATICSRLADQAVSEEAKATLAYLGEMWRVIVNVADVVEANQSHQPLGDDSLHLSPK
jgi:DNA-directed RNA polymerase beta' subunit